MAWDRRSRGGRYYTRSVRTGGRVTKEYLDCGPGAELAAYEDERERAAREALRCQERAERERLREVDELLAGFSADVKTLTHGTLLAAGYHRHQRGEWRRRRAG